MVAIVGAEDALAKAVLEREAAGRSARSNWDTLWQSCARYCLPREATFTETVTPGHERNRWILDSTAPRSLELFASFLHTLMNNPARQWFKLRIEGVDKPSVAHRQWLEMAEQKMLLRMVKAKVYNHLHQAFLFLGGFGTSVIYVEGGLGTPYSIRHFNLQDCVVEEGDDGNVDAVYRQLMRTPRQAVQRWQEGAGKQIVETAKSGRDQSKKFRFVHATFPMDEPGLGEYVPAKIRDLGGAFASVWVNAEEMSVVHVGHYHEFPYMVPRWYQTGDEVYGRSPAMSVLPSIRMANRMQETILRGAEKIVDPPMMLPYGSLLSPLRMFPGSITFSDGMVTPQPLIPPGASRIEMGHQLLTGVQGDIEKGFFVPLFVDIDEKVKTATQVLQEADERNRAVSPMLMRTQTELYDPFTRRTFNVLHRAGDIPEPPEDLRGDLTVEFVSPLTASQRQAEGLSVLRLFESVAPWHGVDSGAFDRFDTDQIAEVLHSASGAPAKILRGDTAVKGVRASRLKQQQMAEQMAQLQMGADAGAKLMTASAKQGA